MDRRLTHLLENYVQTDDDRGVADLLVEAVIKSCSKEIDQAVNRHLLNLGTIARRSASSTSIHQSPVEQDFSNTNVVLQRRLKVVVDSVANGRAFKHFRSIILSSCTDLVEKLWLTNASGQKMINFRPLFLGHNRIEENPILSYTKNQHCTLDTNTDGGEDSGNELSFSMSLDQSVRTVAGRELESIVELIVSEGIDQKDRLANIHKLLVISLSVLAKSRTSIEFLLINFHAVLRQQILFGDAMRFLARLLSSKDEVVWSKVAVTTCSLAPSVLSKDEVDMASKIRFVDFILQMFNQGPKTWRRFSSPALSSILLSFLELLTSEFITFSQFTMKKSKFLCILAHLQPSAEWISVWLHCLHSRKIIARKLVELLENFVDSVNNHFSRLQTPSSSVMIEVSSVVLRSIRHKDILGHLDSQSVSTYISTIFILLSDYNQSVLNNSIQGLLLQFSSTHAGANYLVNYSLQNLLPSQLPSILKLKLACNTLIYCSQPPAHFSTTFHSLVQLANQSLEAHSRSSITCQRPSLVMRVSRKAKSSHQNMVYQLFNLLLKAYHPLLLHSNGLHITQLTAKNQQIDMADSLHTSLLLSTGFLVGKGRSALRAWRKQSSKWLVSSYLSPQKEKNHPAAPVGRSPHCLELLSEEDKRFAFTALMEFLAGRNKKLHKMSQLDFLLGVGKHFLTTSTVVLIAQPGLAIRLLRSMNLQHYLEGQLNGVDAGKDQTVEFLQSLHLLMTNLEVVVELRRGTQLGAKLMQMLQKYCYSSVDNGLIVDKLSVQIFKVVASMAIRGGWAERSRSNTDPPSSSQLEEMIENMPRSFYLRAGKSKKRRKDSKKSQSIDSYADAFLEGCGTCSDSSSSSSWEQREGIEGEEEETRPALEESIKRDWLRLMSVDQGVGQRRRSLWMGEAQHRLIIRLFSRKKIKKSASDVSDTAIGLLKEYIKWMEEGNSQTSTTHLARLNTKMSPSQGEWLAPLLDYAVYGLGKASSRQSAIQKCAELKFVSVSSKSSDEPAADWFLGILFLCADLDAKTTNHLAGKLMYGTSISKPINCLWPMATFAGCDGQACAFNDTISTTVYPKVLAILHVDRWRWLNDWLSTMELPLLHLLLLYTNQLYLNLLNFDQIEEYLVLAVAAGPDFQAAHFLALLLHIAQSQVALPLGRQLVHLSRALRLQQFLHPSSQMLQVMAGFRFLHFLHLFQEE